MEGNFVVGLDLSLTGTGWATYNGKVAFGTLSPPKHKRDGMRRIGWMLSKVLRIVESEDYAPKLVAIEGLAFASRDRNLERAGLAFMVRYMLWRRNIPYVLVAPTSLKKYAAGSGKAEKSQMMLKVYQRWKIEPANDNEADAISLVHVAKCVAGLDTPKTKSEQKQIERLKSTIVRD